MRRGERGGYEHDVLGGAKGEAEHGRPFLEVRVNVDGIALIIGHQKVLHLCGGKRGRLEMTGQRIILED